MEHRALKLVGIRRGQASVDLRGDRRLRDRDRQYASPLEDRGLCGRDERR